HGIDISSKMLAVAKRKAAERTIKNVDFKQSTLSGAGYQKEAFNVILGFNILHLLEDAGKGVQGINELLKPGGLFISATPCLGEEKTFLGKSLFFLSKLGLVPQIRHFQISELEGLIANGDFQIVEAENSSDSPPNYFIVAKKPG
ncbi:MAG: class I SAM-dependent methyltransferase, partial [bacterium]|nr:class I SAM-dependent methyltransferase [bacterium]